MNDVGIDVALDVRETSHLSAGMLAYLRALRAWLPRVAPDLRIAEFGRGDNFDLAEQLGMPLTLARMQPRLAHFATPYVPRFVPVPYVVTVHDVIDLEFPQYGKRKVGPYWRYVVGPVLRGARAVITDDDATVDLLARYAGVDPARVRVIPLGVDAPDPLPPPIVRERPYLFYAGNHRPHKDLPTLVRAWASLPQSHDADLLLTGDAEPTLQALGDRGVHGALVFLGALDDDALWRYHRGAAAYVHPALREGFGLPLLEALQAGAPVIAARSAVPQVLAGAVEVFPPGDVARVRALLVAALTTPSPRVPAATHLTWERTARATAAVYRELIA